METIYHNDSNKSGVYKIYNKLNNRIYIGSAKSFKVRCSQHKNSLLNNKHDNKFLQNDFNKCGEESFVFEVLEVVEGAKENRLNIEQKYLDKYWDRQVNCYNISKFARSSEGVKANSIPWNKGKKFPNKRFSETQKRFIKEHYGKISAAELAKQLNCTKYIIHHFCHANDIKANKSGRYDSVFFNKNFFKTNH